MTRRRLPILLLPVAAALALAACGGDDDSSSGTTAAATTAAPDTTAAATTAPGTGAPATTGAATTAAATTAPATSEAATTAPAELQHVTILLPGTPGAASGGFVAASTPEIAGRYGVEIELQNGGQGVFNTIPQVAAGEVDFSVSSSPNIYAARAESIPVVQIVAGYDYPVCLMFHEGAGITDFPDLNGRTVAVTPGSAYWEYLKATYSLDVNEVSYSGDIAAWAADDSLVQQCISLNEPYIATQQGIAHQELLVSSSGFNPYQNVVFTTEQVIADDPDLVAAVSHAIADGWAAYLADPAPYNDMLVDLGSTQDLDQMAWAAEQLRDVLFTGDIGVSDPARMETLYDQLRSANVLGSDIDWQAAFTNDFVS